VILRNKNASNQQQSMLDKIKLFKSGQQIAVNEHNSQQTNNKSESTVSKRTSSSSGFSSAKSDSSASLCGVETSVSTIVNNKLKPNVTVSKTRTPNYNTNSFISLNTSTNSNIVNNSNSNSNSNLSINNNQLKKSEEVLNCENNKTINNNNKVFNPNVKLGSIPVKRLQPPRSRPTSTIIESSIPSTMASNSQSTSNTSLTTIAKPTAAVKGTSKVFASEETVSRITSTRKFESHPSNQEQTSQATNSSKLKASSNPIAQQQQQTPPQQPSVKPEPSIAMVSPIMAREQQTKSNDKIETLNEEKDSKAQLQKLQQPSTSRKNTSKQSDTSKQQKVEEQQKQQQQQESQLDSASSSHGEESASNSDVDSALVNIKPMAPLVRTSQFAFMRSNANSNNSNGTQCSRFVNNYSNIENGYLSDCALLDNNLCTNSYRVCGAVTGHEAGYLSESGVCSPQVRRNQILAPKPDYMSPTHRHYHDNDRLEKPLFILFS
jgi:neuron navigator 2